MEEKKNIPQDIQPIQLATKVNAPIERVWEAITNPAALRKWFFDIDLDDLQDGDAFQFTAEVNGENVLHECFVLEMEKPSKLRYTWAYPELSKGSSTVNWDLEDEGNQTDVIVTQETIHELLDSGLPITTETFLSAWKEIILERLKPYVEGE